MQFVKIFETFPDSTGMSPTLESKINAVLVERAARVVQVLPCPIEKIGGVDMHLLVVFEVNEQREDPDIAF